MNTKILKIFFTLVIMLMTCTIVFATNDEIEVPEKIRIGLYTGSSALDSVELSSDTGIEIGVMNDGEFEYFDEVRANKTITVSKGSSAGSVYVSGIGEIGSKNEYPYFKSVTDGVEGIIEINGTPYRGNVEIRRFSDSDMTIINHVSMQGYLYGVVPREIGGNSPIEAVKAQAIVARTYAVKNYGRRSGWGFDLYPTTSDQAYGGYSWENENSNRAVDETDGQVIVYDGELIGGYYFSTSGGYTESSVNVWGGEFEYLTAVPDYYEPEVAGNTTWEVELTAKEVKAKLAEHNIYVGDILDIVPTEYTDAGRVLELKIVGTDGTETIMKSKTREYLGLKSQWYTVNDEAPQVKQVDIDDLLSKNSNKDDTDNTGKTNSKSDKNEEDKVVTKNPDYIGDEEDFVIDTTNMKPLLKYVLETILGKNTSNEEDSENKDLPQEEVVEEKVNEEKADKVKTDEVADDEIVTKNTEYRAKSSNTFTFRGRGWGHAVGMSQNGAKGMAEEGFTADEIITWYYSGVEIVG